MCVFLSLRVESFLLRFQIVAHTHEFVVLKPHWVSVAEARDSAFSCPFSIFVRIKGKLILKTEGAIDPEITP